MSLIATPLTTLIPNRARIAPRTCRTVHSPLSCALRVRHMIDVIMRPSLAGITMLANCADASCLSSRRVTDPELRRFCSRCDVPAGATGTAPTMICVITGSTAAVQTVDCICAALQEVWCCCNPSPTLALTLHTSLRRSAASDSHLLQTGACRACMSAACVYQSLLLCVCLRSVLTHLYVYVRQGICRHRLVPRLQVLV